MSRWEKASKCWPVQLCGEQDAGFPTRTGEHGDVGFLMVLSLRRATAASFLSQFKVAALCVVENKHHRRRPK